KIMAVFEAPGDSVFGFEHRAKSEAEKKKQAMASETLKSGFGPLLQVTACKLLPTKAAVSVEYDGAHSEVRATHEYRCEEAGERRADVDFSKAFPRIRRLHVQVLGEKGQSASELKNGKG